MAGDLGAAGVGNPNPSFTDWLWAGLLDTRLDHHGTIGALLSYLLLIRWLLVCWVFCHQLSAVRSDLTAATKSFFVPKHCLPGIRSASVTSTSFQTSVPRASGWPYKTEQKYLMINHLNGVNDQGSTSPNCDGWRAAVTRGSGQTRTQVVVKRTVETVREL